MPERHNLPSVDRVLTEPNLATAVARFGRGRVKQAVQAIQEGWRARLRTGSNSKESGAAGADNLDAGQDKNPELDPTNYLQEVNATLRPKSYQPVFNLTGTTIHTNLGRSLLSTEIWREVEPLLTQPMNLEFDLQTGRRGQREAFVCDRLCQLTGAEAACLVNNNAAALMLVLNTLALNQEVPVSRGELIEIGGSFRLPELMTRSGCQLIEVGSTNRTHLHDYEGAITQATALLLKVHPSNFEIQGFTKTTSLKELASLAAQHSLPLVEDLGSGSLIDLTKFNLPAEPTPQQSLRAGADLVTFSGDKLLGGVQAGIIVGQASLIAQINKNPLKRALRLDKVALTLLDAVLKRYEDPEHIAQTIPLLKTLTTPATELDARARQLSQFLTGKTTGPKAVLMSIEPCEGQIGSGALPTRPLASVALRVTTTHPNRLMQQLRQLPTPVIARVHDGSVWLDMRGAADMDALLANLESLNLDDC